MKTKYKYTFQIIVTISTDWETNRYIKGTYSSVATSEKKAINNICFREGFRNHDNGEQYVEYTYKLLEVEEEKLIQEDKMPEDNWPKDEDGEPLPLYKTEDGIDYILADSGEYVEIYD